MALLLQLLAALAWKQLKNEADVMHLNGLGGKAWEVSNITQVTFRKVSHEVSAN